MKESVIVYALGRYWRNEIETINSQYNIIACSDQNTRASEVAGEYMFVAPETMQEISCDKVIIGCLKHESMRELIAYNYNIPWQKIFYFEELFGNTERKKMCGSKRHGEKLTVVIPTYNRRERLRRTLRLLELQTDDDFKIIVMDNCSNYNINDLVEEYTPQFQKRIKVIRNKINIGAGANIANAFIQGVSGWMWLLGDDDIPSIYAVEHIYEEIESSDQMGVIHFVVHDFTKHLPKGYKDFRNLHELLRFYQSIVERGQDIGLCNGDFIYCSNRVYNMKYVFEYCNNVVKYAYSAVPNLVPILFMLNDSAAYMRISCKRIVTWDMPMGDHWNCIETLSGMRIVTDFKIDLDQTEKMMLYRLLLYAYTDELLEAVKQQSFNYDIEQIEKLYREVYQYCLDDEEKNNFYQKIQALKKEHANLLGRSKIK